MKKIILVTASAVLINGCALPGMVNDRVLDREDMLCTTIKNVDNILPNHVLIKDRDTDVGVAIPSTPIDVKFKHTSEGTVIRLSEVMNQDNIALRSFQYLLVVGRNAAPCDPDNIRMFWQSVDNLTNKTYLLKNEMIKK
ncbi:MAG: hypothetical protein IMF12_03160 [Proteobacteria bacterium]|nr:hypothetical protein [Pseudomonadota bacterium]